MFFICRDSIIPLVLFFTDKLIALLENVKLLTPLLFYVAIEVLLDEELLLLVLPVELVVIYTIPETIMLKMYVALTTKVGLLSFSVTDTANVPISVGSIIGAKVYVGNYPVTKFAADVGLKVIPEKDAASNMFGSLMAGRVIVFVVLMIILTSNKAELKAGGPELTSETEIGILSELVIGANPF